MNAQILVFGKNSFVASGIDKTLEEAEYNVDFFTRGKNGRKNNVISGKTDSILTNSFFKEQYKSIINSYIFHPSWSTITQILM